MRILNAGLGAVAVVLLSAGPAVASAQVERVAGDVEFSYSAPEISEEGDHVSWNWTIHNLDSRDAHKVVMTHKLIPALPITYVSQPCQAAGDTVRCKWDTIAAGQSIEGVIEADLPSTVTGSVNIKGRVVWQKDVVGDKAGAAAPSTLPAPTVVYTPVDG